MKNSLSVRAALRDALAALDEAKAAVKDALDWASEEGVAEQVDAAGLRPATGAGSSPAALTNNQDA